MCGRRAAVEPFRRATATALVVLGASSVTIWNTVRGAGPFTGAEVHESLILLQTFTGVLAGTGLLLAAAIFGTEDERTPACRRLRPIRGREARRQTEKASPWPASIRPSSRMSSSASGRPTARSVDSTEDSAWVSPSFDISSNFTAVRCAPTVPGREKGSTFTVELPRADHAFEVPAERRPAAVERFRSDRAVSLDGCRAGGTPARHPEGLSARGAATRIATRQWDRYAKPAGPAGTRRSDR